MWRGGSIVIEDPMWAHPRGLRDPLQAQSAPMSNQLKRCLEVQYRYLRRPLVPLYPSNTTGDFNMVLSLSPVLFLSFILSFLFLFFLLKECTAHTNTIYHTTCYMQFWNADDKWVICRQLAIRKLDSWLSRKYRSQISDKKCISLPWRSNRNDKWQRYFLSLARALQTYVFILFY